MSLFGGLRSGCRGSIFVCVKRVSVSQRKKLGYAPPKTAKAFLLATDMVSEFSVKSKFGDSLRYETRAGSR